MDVSSLIIKNTKTESKPEEETGDFPVSSANKGRTPAGLLQLPSESP
jgi:hypothetical protein